MKTGVGRADLITYLVDHKITDLDLIADCFGYEAKKKARRSSEILTIPSKEEVHKEKKPRDINLIQAEPAKEPANESFLRVTSISSDRTIPTEEPVLATDFLESKLEALQQHPKQDSIMSPPEEKPLLEWERLWPLLQNMLAGLVRKSKADIPRIVHFLANARVLDSIPCLACMDWAADSQIIFDFPERLYGFAGDYNRLVRSLAKLRGEYGLHVHQVKILVEGDLYIAADNDEGQVRWLVPDIDVPVLILGDAGVFGTNAEQAAWLDFGRKLNASGCRPFLLTPAPYRYLNNEIVAYFRCVYWDRLSDLQVISAAGNVNAARANLRADKQKVSRILLPWLSVALLIEPALLREACRLLSVYYEDEFDAGFEALCWVHTDVERTTIGIRIRHEKLHVYRQRFWGLVEDQPELLQQYYRLLCRYHGYKQESEFFGEINLLAETGMLPRDENIVAAEKFYWRLVQKLYEADDARSCRHYGYHLLSRQSRQSKQQNEVYSSLWAVLESRLQISTSRPEWVKTDYATPFLNRITSRRQWHVVQWGEQLLFTDDELLWNHSQLDITRNLAPLFSFETSGTLLIMETKQPDGKWVTRDLQLLPNKEQYLSIPDSEIKLQVENKTYHIDSVELPKWADGIGYDETGLYIDHSRFYGGYRSPWRVFPDKGKGYWGGLPTGEIGEDKFGIFVDIIFEDFLSTGLFRKNPSQRFRWIPPGTFMMGSPDNEAGRYNDETQHEVELTQGFWLGDTAVTQVLWEAVMGENPSRFRDDPNNPVEQVSWNDVMEFIEKLNARCPELEARLPSEAQWEYACRAGTQTPFSFGENITSEQVNYDGNIPYAGGKKGVYRGTTVAVKSLPPNAWGLYEMHGNVWEWCSDVWREEPPGGRETDPDYQMVVEQRGAQRVVRGGSWRYYGGNCRSALRSGLEPDYRNDKLGFRLSLGLAELKSAGGAATSGAHQGVRQAGGHQGQPSRGAAADTGGGQSAEKRRKTDE